LFNAEKWFGIYFITRFKEKPFPGIQPNKGVITAIPQILIYICGLYQRYENIKREEWAKE